ncbi:tyrosine-type recombinase/integrase [Thalassobacillus devorans]|uniref:tyrosine-type recombinase/integrase n=1 Tax=Thalassobacillus devorans TaxID=279813 RepID=UPI000A1CBB67|nr:tyrosine-type recombinase/integrase [Thalassobacillus devorans]
MFIEDLLKEYLFHLEFKGYSTRTQRSYKTNLMAFLKYAESEFGITELEEIKSTHIKQYGMYMTKKGRKATYINNIFKAVRSFINYCIDEGYLMPKFSPTAKVQWLKESKPVINAFTPEEIRDMVNAFKTNTFIEARNKLIIMMLADTGIRNLELCQLMQSNIGATTIKIVGKGNKERYIAISPALNKYLLKYRRIREHYLKNDFNGHDNLFLSFTGKPLTVEAVERVVKVAGERAGITRDIRISPHTIRHTYAQMMLMNGIDVYSLSRLLGHENINITKRYLQSLQDEQIVENSIKSSPLMNM